MSTIVLSAGCGAGTDADAGFVTRDSAGIRIVENATPMWGDGEGKGEGWRLSPEPMLQIGVVEGDTLYQFGWIQEAARFPDGRIAVADVGIMAVRVYGTDGEFLLALGGEGEGPGEFQGISGIEILPGDSIAIYDPDLDRLTVYGPGGSRARTTSLSQATAARMGEFERFPDGTLVLGPNGWSSAQLSSQERQAGTAVYRPRAPILRYSPDGTLMDTIGIFPGFDVAFGSISGSPFIVTPPFAHSLVYAVRDDRIHIGTQTTYEIRAYTSDGVLRGIIRGPERDLVVTDAMMDDLMRRLSARMPEDAQNRDLILQMYQATPAPDTRAAYGRILVDAAHHLWVEVEEPATQHTQETAWTVFNPNGRMLGKVEVPDRFHIYQVGEDYVLGRWRDEFDVQYVRMYALVK